MSVEAQTMSRKPSARAESHSALPVFIAPQLATLSSIVPTGANWLYEDKFDGYRILARIENGSVRLLTRNGNDWTEKFHSLAEELKLCGAKETVYLDGEVVAEAGDGRSSFEALQNYFRFPKSTKISYQVFDLLWHGKRDLRQLPLLTRKKILKETFFTGAHAKFKKSGVSLIRYTEHMTDSPEEFLRSQCEAKKEGMICKLSQSTYISGRTRNWLKVKCSGNDEFIIAGFTKLTKHESAIGALLLARYRGDELIYCGKVGTGFSSSDRVELYRALSTITIASSPLAGGPRIADAVWVKPMVVAQVTYTERTAGGLLRHPSFTGIRADKKPKEVTDDEP